MPRSRTPPRSNNRVNRRRNNPDYDLLKIILVFLVFMIINGLLIHFSGGTKNWTKNINDCELFELNDF